MWLHGWFAGAALVTPENSIETFFEKSGPTWPLSPHGRKAAEVLSFMRSHDRGVPYTPVAIVLDHLAGYNGYMDKPWGILPPTQGDRETRDLFDFQLFPGSDHIHTNPFPANPELSYLRPTPYGEMFDVLLTSVTPETLASYPAVLLVGDIDFDPAFTRAMEHALRLGTRVLMAPRHRAALGEDFLPLARLNPIEVLPISTNLVTGRPAAIPDARLGRLVEELLPVAVTGDPVQYQVNRNPRGWVVELIHNGGVTKFRDRPAVVDPKAVARVRVAPLKPCLLARQWRSGATSDHPREVEVALGPGEVEYVEFEFKAGTRPLGRE